jgi:hypothetical protein
MMEMMIQAIHSMIIKGLEAVNNVGLKRTNDKKKYEK